jgi:hypothetical protein
MAVFKIKRIKEGEKAWSWDYIDGLTLKIKEEPYRKGELTDILKGLQNAPDYEVYKDKKLAVFYYTENGNKQQLAWWEMGNDPIEKLLNEFKNAKLDYQYKENDPNQNKNMQHNNVGTGETGS